MQPKSSTPQVDLHTHVLPGLDDGAPNLDHALAMLRIAAEDGTRIIVATPHARRCTPEAVAQALRSLEAALAETELPITLLTGMEEQLLPDLPERLLTEQSRPLAATRWVLVELPDWTTWPADLPTRLQQLRLAGFRPLLAHVERYIPVQHEPELVREALEAGALLQVNADSLFGQNGYAAQQVAVRLLRAGAISVLASDAHSPDWRPPRLQPAFERVAALTSPELAEYLRSTAWAILQDAELAPPTPKWDLLREPLTFLERLRAWVGV